MQNFLLAYEIMGCNMSLEMYFIHSHLDFFPENCGDFSDEHGEISTMEEEKKKDTKDSGVPIC